MVCVVRICKLLLQRAGLHMLHVHSNHIPYMSPRMHASQPSQDNTHTCGMMPGQMVLATLHSSTPSCSAALNAWSVAYGGATPVVALINSLAAFRLAARLGRAWLGRMGLPPPLLPVSDGRGSCVW